MAHNMIFSFAIFFISFFINFFLSYFNIKHLKKHNIGQFIREDGPSTHRKKSGTPTGGGITFLFTIIICSFIMTYYFFPDKFSTLIFLLTCFLAYSFVGLVDDLLKIFKKKNLGMTFKEKIIVQLLISFFIFIFFGNFFYHPGMQFLNPLTKFPFFYSLMIIILLTGYTNASNLSDGLDGLLILISIISFSFLAIFSYIFSNFFIFYFLLIVIAAFLSFYYYNRYPAKIFMGDTGSLGIGPLFVAICYCISMDFYILSLGIVYIIEAASVILQVFYFKYTKLKFGKGKRIFLMSPYHHHLELKYNSELKATCKLVFINFIFCLFTALVVLFFGKL